MPANDEEAKAKLVEYKSNAAKKTDAAADILHKSIDSARDGVKSKLEDGEQAVDNIKEDAEHTKRGIVESVDQYSEIADQKAGEYLEMVKASANNAQLAFDDSLVAASDAVKNGAAQARSQYSYARQRGEEIWETAVAHSQGGLDILFDNLKDGVDVMREHEKTTLAVGTAAALVLLPGPRRVLWRQTFGRLRSEEGIFRSAELRATHLQQNITSHSAEAKKLEERLVAAQAQYTAGLAKVVATNRQLQSLQNSVSKTEQSASSLLETLRELPSAQALKLRAEVAMSLAAAKAQRIALDRQTYKLSKKGF